MGAPGVLVTRQPGAEFHSKDDAKIAFAARHALAVEMLEQGNRVFARNTGEVFELRDVDGRLAGARLVLGEHGPQRCESVLMEDEVVTQFDQRAVAQQQRDDLGGFIAWDLQSDKDLGQRWYFEPGGGEGADDLLHRL